MRASSVVLLPHAPSSVAVARQYLRSELIASGVRQSVVDDVNVIMSELLSNALRHVSISRFVGPIDPAASIGSRYASSMSKMTRPVARKS